MRAFYLCVKMTTADGARKYSNQLCIDLYEADLVLDIHSEMADPIYLNR